MVLNRVCFAAFGVMILAWSGPSAAQQYRPNEFLNLDLSRAVLSPTPLGPVASFSPGPLDVTVDRGKDAAPASAELVVDPKTVVTATVHAENDSTPKNSTPKNSTCERQNGRRPTSRMRWSRFTGGIPWRRKPVRPPFRPGPASPAASATGSDKTARWERMSNPLH
jgi:hypothetical protein